VAAKSKGTHLVPSAHIKTLPKTLQGIFGTWHRFFCLLYTCPNYVGDKERLDIFIADVVNARVNIFPVFFCPP
jgi:hypothetical protein